MDGKNVDACEITKKQDVARDAQGKWKRGVSGNPAGRTPGPAKRSAHSTGMVRKCGAT